MTRSRGAGGSRGVHWASLVYRALLRAYPRDVRRRDGREMVQLFVDMVSQLRTRGRAAVILYIVRTLADLPASAFAAHRDAHRTRQLRPGTRRPARVGLLTGFGHDLRYAVRSLRQTPGFTAVAVVTLALGIGANSAIFSVVHGVVLRPLPYPDPEDLVLLWSKPTGTESGDRSGLSGPDLMDLRTETTAFDGLVGSWAIGTNLTHEGTAQQITLSWVSTDFFSVLGVPPALGRMFDPDDENHTDLALVTQPDFSPPANVMVLSHGLWERVFGSDPSVVGRTIRVNGQPMHIIGVAPAGFRLHLPAYASMPTAIDAWTLFPIDLARGNRGTFNLTVFGRLAGGEASRTQVQAELDRVAAGLRDRFPVHRTRGTEFELLPLHAEVVGHVRPTLFVLLGSVGLVLLIACANVANLLLVRGSSRQRELAIRAALGGGRARIIRQLLTESMLLAGAGAGCGVLLAAWGIDLLKGLRPADLPRVGEIGLDGTVLAFTGTVTVLAAGLFGMIPALQGGRRAATPTLNDRSRTGSVSHARGRGALVVVEVALSLVLLVGAGLLLRSFVTLQRVQLGFESTNVLTANISLPFFAYRDWNRRGDFFQSVLDRVRELDGVDGAGGISPLPLTKGGPSWTGGYATEEAALDWSANQADYRPVWPGFFRAVGATVVTGRALTDADNRADSRSVALVDAVLAERIWPDHSPIGERLLIPVPDETQTGSRRAWTEVVGVVAPIRHQDLTEPSRGTVYVPYRTYGWFEMSLVVRAAGPPLALAAPIRRIVSELDPSLPVFSIRTMDAYLTDARAPMRFSMILVGLFALLAALLASVGLYGVVAFVVRQRTQEIGVRMAFGAGRGSILRMVVGHGLGLTGAGITAGMAAALVGTRPIRHLLFGVRETDPATYLAIALLLVVIAAAACALPALRATRVDPVVALRSD